MNNLTLNNILLSARNNLGFTIEEVEKLAGLKKTFLIAFEKGLYSQLPPPAYSKGYLKSLAKVYNLDSDDLIRVYENEINYNTHYKANQDINPVQNIRKSFNFTPSTLTGSLFFLFFASIAIYLFWQIQHVTAAPELEVINPINNQQINSNHILVNGNTEPGSILTINNQTTEVNSDGKFSQTVFVSPGENQIIIKSENRFSKSAEIIKTVIVAPDAY